MNDLNMQLLMLAIGGRHNQSKYNIYNLSLYLYDSAECKYIIQLYMEFIRSHTKLISSRPVELATKLKSIINIAIEGSKANVDTTFTSYCFTQFRVQGP